MEFKAHSKRQRRGPRAFPRTETPLCSPHSLPRELPAPAQIKQKSSLCPLPRALGDRGDEGTDGGPP